MRRARALLVLAGLAVAATLAPAVRAQHSVSDPGAHGGAVTSVRVRPDGSEALTASMDGGVLAWDLETDELESRLLARLDGPVLDLACFEGGGVLCLVEPGRLVRLDPAGEAREVARHPGGARALAVEPGSGRLATAGTDGTIRLWAPTDDGRSDDPEVLRGHEGPVADVAFGDRRLWSVGWDGTLRAWSVRAGRARGEHPLGERELRTVAVGPDGRVLLAAGWDGTVHLVDARSGRRAALPDRAHAQWIRDAAVSPDGRRVAAVAAAERRIVWASLDEPDRVRVAGVGRVGSEPAALAFLPGGAELLVGRFDGAVDVVALEEGGDRP